MAIGPPAGLEALDRYATERRSDPGSGVSRGRSAVGRRAQAPVVFLAEVLALVGGTATAASSDRKAFCESSRRVVNRKLASISSCGVIGPWESGATARVGRMPSTVDAAAETASTVRRWPTSMAF